MAGDRKVPSTAGASAVDEFVKQVDSLPANRASGSRGRLLFAMDATASREPTWDHACAIQGEMFVAADALVGTVHCELFSTVNSLLTGKITANFVESQRSPTTNRRCHPQFQGLGHTLGDFGTGNICHKNREFTGRNRDRSGLDQ